MVGTSQSMLYFVQCLSQGLVHRSHLIHMYQMNEGWFGKWFKVPYMEYENSQKKWIYSLAFYSFHATFCTPYLLKSFSFFRDICSGIIIFPEINLSTIEMSWYYYLLLIWKWFSLFLSKISSSLTWVSFAPVILVFSHITNASIRMQPPSGKLLCCFPSLNHQYWAK